MGCEKQRILIVDDEEINRIILKGVFEEDYEILEAEDGRDAIQQIESNSGIVLVLLDLVMPVLNGFEVLEYMQEHDLIEKLPVILITGETVGDSEDRAYSYGIADVMHKPFYPYIVKRRAKNIIELYQNKRDMEKRLKEQEETIKLQEKRAREDNEFVIHALSSIVEFRNFEAGEHIRRIKYFTKTLLELLMKNFPEYGLNEKQIDEMVRAAALHDIGKIAIPDSILLKPGTLTPEETAVMRTHTSVGCDILKRFCENQKDDFYRYCYEICKYHHERWDGNGYPEHLAGNTVPICAQVVAIADAYDELVSPRVYKSAYDAGESYNMIMNGECGQFSPDILECFRLARDDFFNTVEVMSLFDFA